MNEGNEHQGDSLSLLLDYFLKLIFHIVEEEWMWPPGSTATIQGDVFP